MSLWIVFQLHEQQRDAVDEADDVRPAAVKIALYPELAHGKKVVVGRLVEIEDPQPPLDPLSLFVAEPDLDPILEQAVFVAVGGDQALGRAGFDDLPDGLAVGVRGRPGLNSIA